MVMCSEETARHNGDGGDTVTDASKPHSSLKQTGDSTKINAPTASQLIQQAQIKLRPEALLQKKLSNSSATQQHQTVCQLQPRELKARLDRPMTKHLVDSMGFDQQLVKQAIYERLLATGEDFESAERLAMAVFELQDKQQNEMTEYSSRLRRQGNEISQMPPTISI